MFLFPTKHGLAHSLPLFMTSFLLRLEAIESRIPSHSYSCPRGTTGRVHTLRLRRCFQTYTSSRSIVSQPTSLAKSPTSFEKEAQSPQSEQASQSLQLKIRRSSKFLTSRFPIHRRFPTRDIGGNGPRNTRSDGNLTIGVGHTSREEVPEDNLDGNLSLIDPDVLGPDILQSFTDGIYYGDVLPLDVSSDASTGNLANLYRSLKTGNHHMVLMATMNLIQKTSHLEHVSDIFRSLPPTTFSEILRCLDPKHFVGRYSDLAKELSINNAHHVGFPPVDPHGHYAFSLIFFSQIKGIIEARLEAGFNISLTDYKYLLKCARITGDKSAVDAIWATLALKYVPDTECYNHLLATKCWGDMKNPSQRHRLRIVPRNTAPREREYRPVPLQGHRIGQHGIKHEVSMIFHNMVKEGSAGNEETFCLMIVALAREADMVGIASILKRVWDIDVEAIINNESVSQAKPYPLDSPFYPTDRLLMAIAHSYGINNSIPTAIRLVDYVSQQYSLNISNRVWSELLERTYVLSLPRNSKSIESGNAIGQLPPQALSQLWATMTSEPYNVKPTIKMYDPYIKNLISRQRFGEAEIRMNEARALYSCSYQEWWKMKKNLSLQEAPISRQQHQDYDFISLRLRIDKIHITRWVYKFISRGSRSLKYVDNWTSQKIPDFIRLWRHFQPYWIRYSHPTGAITFRTSSASLKRKYANRTLLRSKFQYQNEELESVESQLKMLENSVGDRQSEDDG
ncbi:hypothetical protein B7494_g5597 [Chlorociboria aeruginascens]|nr:hypothetical protein B7494_g5597 [Chlorociboria aeruginascens]